MDVAAAAAATLQPVWACPSSLRRDYLQASANEDVLGRADCMVNT